MARYIGDEIDKAVKVTCDAPAIDDVLIVDPGDRKKGLWKKVGSKSIGTDAVLGEHLRGLDFLVFGQPRDGSFVADGVATMPGGIVPAGNAYTLTRDMNFGRLTINSGVTIKTNGFRLIAHVLELKGTAVIHNDGGGGGPASGQTAGTGGAAAGPGSISYSTEAGRAGGAGSPGTGGTPGAPGADGGRAMSPALGGAGGLGGEGVHIGANPENRAGRAGLKPAMPVTAPKGSVLGYPKIAQLFDEVSARGCTGGGAGTGGGGGGGSSGNPGGGGGGGGAGGGVCLVVASIVDAAGGAWTGRISANGGNGGDAAAHGGGSGGGGSGGCGGGGGGGAAILIARRIIGQINPSTALGYDPPFSVMARGGAKGTGNTILSTPAEGGLALVMNLSELFTPPSEIGKPPILDARPIYPTRSRLRVGGITQTEPIG